MSLINHNRLVLIPKSIHYSICSLQKIVKNPITTLIKRPTKKGNNYYFNIPIEYIGTGKVNPNKEYELQIYEIKGV
ncbi:MAG: hypothetical protein ACFFAH_12715 [Promethearchaeota archaeon]